MKKEKKKEPSERKPNWKEYTATVVNNVILVLIGEQGSYKTTWFNHLLPPELSDYFYTKTNASRMGRDKLLTLAQYGLRDTASRA